MSNVYRDKQNSLCRQHNFKNYICLTSLLWFSERLQIPVFRFGRHLQIFDCDPFKCATGQTSLKFPAKSIVYSMQLICFANPRYLRIPEPWAGNFAFEKKLTSLFKHDFCFSFLELHLRSYNFSGIYHVLSFLLVMYLLFCISVSYKQPFPVFSFY